ncbi:MAG: hypothetical protein US70_C0019G0004 [Parcubacteria group bacterium GW2011_GWD2_38_11]|nr:MAG: hypothetical protein US70_C0019G0004 [Parcubacteria group bacterium GW2011_GWD2_38_11]
MQLKKITINKNILLLTYKLAYDLLLLLLLTFAATLAAEGLLPGLVSSKISFSKITIILFLVLTLIAYLGKKLSITYNKTKISKNKILPIIILFSFLLIGSSMLKFTLWENISIALITLFVFFLFYELIFSSENE